MERGKEKRKEERTMEREEKGAGEMSRSTRKEKLKGPRR